MAIIERGDVAGLIPEEYISDIIAEAQQASIALRYFTRVNIPTKVNNLPVVNALPVATWVTGEPDDTGAGGEKTATEQIWKNAVLTAEEIAAIVVIPEAVLEDSTIDLWAEVSEHVGQAVGFALDQAVLSGTNAPASFEPLATTAITKTNTLVETPTTEAGYNSLLALVEADGFMNNLVITKPSEAAGFRGFNASGVPIYLNDVRSDGNVASIYGVPLAYSNALAATHTAIAGDPTKCIIGVRRDLTYKVLTEATIDLGGGNSVNLAQQDSVALRVRARFGQAVANPATQANANEATRYPFAVITTV